MKEGLYIFESSEDFLNCIDEMENSFSSDFQYLDIHLNSMKDIDKEIRLLNKGHIKSWNGFISKGMIKVSLKLYDSLFNVTYIFKTNSGNGLYREFYKYLRKRDGVC